MTERNAISETVRKLRTFLSETQEEFARRMNTAVVTIARWETKRPPKGKALKVLEDLAKSKSLDEYADVFSKARRGEIVVPGPRKVESNNPEFRNDQESLYTLALLRILRNPKAYSKQLAQIEKALSVPLADIDQSITNAEAGVDVRGVIVRLSNEGKSQEQIGEILGLDPNDVGQVIVLDHLGYYLRQPK